MTKTVDPQAVLERIAPKLAQDKATAEKCKASIDKALNKASIKVHSRSLLHKLTLSLDELSITVKGKELTIKAGDKSVSFTLTESRSGSLYPHWIKLNKALVELADEVEVIPPLELPSSHKRILALIGFEGEVKNLTSDIVEALQEASTDEDLSKSTRDQAAKTALWVTSFLSNLTNE